MIKKRLSTAILLTLSLSLTACSAKPSADTVETSTEIQQEETKASVTDADTSSNDADTSSNDADESKTGSATEPSTEEETLTESEEEESTEAETEESPESTSSPDESESETEEEAVTHSKTSEKDSTKSETTTSETTTEAVTVQSVSAVVSGTHYVGETLTGADFTVTVTYSDGETLTNPAGWSAQPLTLSSTSNLITVAYEGASVTITVNAENVPETTTAAIVASNTTTITTTKAETTQAATTQATTAATTTAPTTTAAETTTASEIEWVEWADGDYNYALAQSLFIAQNEMRAEAGVDPLIWDDQIYETAKLCAKVCGDNGVIDHSLTRQYREPAERVAYTGETIKVLYDENLERTGSIRLDVKTDDVSYYLDTGGGRYASVAWIVLEAIKDSSGHYETAIWETYQYGAIAVYKMGQTAYISYLFYTNDDDYIDLNTTWGIIS